MAGLFADRAARGGRHRGRRHRRPHRPRRISQRRPVRRHRRAARSPTPATRRGRMLVSDPLIVAWRAMTVALLDRLAPKVRALLGVSEAGLPAGPRCSRAAPGRPAAASPPSAAPSGGPPSPSSATERYSDMDGLTIVSHPLVQHKLTILRDRNSSIQLFRTVVREIATLLCYEVTRDLPTDADRDRDPDRHHPGAGDRRQEARLRADPAGRPAHGRGHARSGALGAPRPYRPLSRSALAPGGRILFQDARGSSPSGSSSSSIRCWPPATPRSPRSTG